MPAYLLTHPDVTNCFVPPPMAGATNKIQVTPNSPHYPTKPNNPVLDNGLTYLLVRRGTPLPSVPHRVYNNIIWTCGERNSTNQNSFRSLQNPVTLKNPFIWFLHWTRKRLDVNYLLHRGKKNPLKCARTHTHVDFFKKNSNKFCNFFGKNLGKLFFSSVNSINFSFFGKKNSNFSISQLWN